MSFMAGPPFWSSRVGWGTLEVPEYIEYISPSSATYDSLDGHLSAINFYYSTANGQTVQMGIKLHSYLGINIDFLWNEDLTPSFSTWTVSNKTGVTDGRDLAFWYAEFSQDGTISDVVVMTPTKDGIAWGPTITIQPQP